MAKRIKKEELDAAIEMYNGYFEHINATYDDLLKKSQKYLNTTEKKIDALAEMAMGTRGAEHYLTEHMENAASLISQCQSLVDSQYKIKKSVIEYAIKDVSNANEGQTTDYTAVIAEVVKQEKEKLAKQNQIVQEILDADQDDLDAEIERILADQSN